MDLEAEKKAVRGRELEVEREGGGRSWKRKRARVGYGERAGVGEETGAEEEAGDEAGDGAGPEPASKSLPRCLWRKCSGVNVANSSNHCFVATAVRTMAPAIDCVVVGVATVTTSASGVDGQGHINCC